MRRAFVVIICMPFFSRCCFKWGLLVCYPVCRLWCCEGACIGFTTVTNNLSCHSTTHDRWWLSIQNDFKVRFCLFRSLILLHQAAGKWLEAGCECCISSFSEAWHVVGRGSFQNLAEFCGVIATLFPGTLTVESDFSMLRRWEKDGFHKSLSDFGLEAVLQAKQHLMLQQI